MSLKERLDRKLDVKSYGYKVNKWILRSAFLLMLLLFLIVVRVDGWDVAVHGSQYVVCEDPLGCVNPYDLSLFDEPSLMVMGESIGFRASGLARLFPAIALGLFALSLLLNHLVYNRNFKVKRKC